MGDGQSITASILDNDKSALSSLDDKALKRYVESFHKKIDIFKEMYRRYGSPQYIIDTAALVKRANEFRKAFHSRLPDFQACFAMKSNNHPTISQILLEHSFGLDVSGRTELEQAIRLEARDILFSGPGKTDHEHQLALEFADRTTVLIDSFGELQRLEKQAADYVTEIRAGVRLTTSENGLWRKFGISPDRLAEFMKSARKCRYVKLQGIQFHNSWNMNADKQTAFIERLGKILAALDERDLSRLEFLDIGGGYWPPAGEWLHGYAASDREGDNIINRLPSSHKINKADKIEHFADRISNALKHHILPHAKVKIYAEPGRWICHDSMHLLLQVIDKKNKDLVITDGGGNMIGWERYETDYFPVINLTHPSSDEHPCYILGSLCTPHDVWGYFYHGSKIEEGDLLLIPSQGAYTYSLHQNFIKPIPQVTRMREEHKNSKSEK